nr:hypothetical protein BaRGS_021793 [Batillaria attramentaria]
MGKEEGESGPDGEGVISGWRVQNYDDAHISDDGGWESADADGDGSTGLSSENCVDVQNTAKKKTSTKKANVCDAKTNAHGRIRQHAYVAKAAGAARPWADPEHAYHTRNGPASDTQTETRIRACYASTTVKQYTQERQATVIPRCT